MAQNTPCLTGYLINITGKQISLGIQNENKNLSKARGSALPFQA